MQKTQTSETDNSILIFTLPCHWSPRQWTILSKEILYFHKIIELLFSEEGVAYFLQFLHPHPSTVTCNSGIFICKMTKMILCIIVAGYSLSHPRCQPSPPPSRPFPRSSPSVLWSWIGSIRTTLWVCEREEQEQCPHWKLWTDYQGMSAGLRMHFW